jgi:hypothetical protein
MKGYQLDVVSIYKEFDGKKYEPIGVYDNDQHLISDVITNFKKHGIAIKVEPISDKQVRMWKRKMKEI